MSASPAVGVIGAGSMGEALIVGLIERAGIAPAQILASAPRAARRDELATAYGVAVTDDNRAVARADTVILAVKPQVFPQVARDVRGALAPDALLLSTIAGLPIARLCADCEHGAVVRAMPNTPARIGAGMTVWASSGAVGSAHHAMAAHILGALGRERHVTREELLDSATAISGSGPAYVFLFLESLIDAGVMLGLPRPIAHELALETLLGAARYAAHDASHPALLRNAVTSPGGTTAAALLAFERAGFRAAVLEAAAAAHRRSQELGRSL